MPESPRHAGDERSCGEFHGTTALQCNAATGHTNDHTTWFGQRAVRTWPKKQDDEGTED